MTFPLLRQNNQYQLRAHRERRPRPQREESRGEWRSRSDGGRELILIETVLLYTDHQTQRSRSNETQWDDELNDTIYSYRGRINCHQGGRTTRCKVKTCSLTVPTTALGPIFILATNDKCLVRHFLII